ncbi:MAG: PQQ-dependent sugar dehydrogenase [Pseudomonadota bacterium]
MPRPALALLLTLLAAPAAAQVFQSSAGPVRVEAVGPELDTPWAMAFLPDFSETGAILVTERGGALKLIEGERAREIAGAPRVAASGQGGLLDVALSPSHAEDGLVYLSYAAPAPRGRANTHVARGRLDRAAGALTDVEVIFEMTSNASGGRHFGSRLVFATDGTLFITTGDRGDRPSAQDLQSHNGKVHRIHPDGSIPADNPFAQGGGLPSIWSYGHRNAQGAARHPETGALWTISHGARGGDEINLPEPGRNYGWPVISYGRHYSGGRIGEGTEKAGMEQPLFYWDPSIAPSGAAFYDGDLFPQWRGDLFVGALRGRRIARVDLEGGEVVRDEPLFEGFGRVRDVRSGPDGALWFLADDDESRLYRVVPAS